MPAYRVYCHDRAGKIEAAHVLKANSDDAAIEAARELTDNARCEVWHRERLVGRVTPPNRALLQPLLTSIPPPMCAAERVTRPRLSPAVTLRPEPALMRPDHLAAADVPLKIVWTRRPGHTA